MIRVAICDDNKVFVNNMSQAVKSEFKRQNNEDIELETYISSELMYQHHLIKPFDLVFLDIDMPEPDGFQLAAKISSSNDCYIIFVTNHPELVYDSLYFRPLNFITKSNDSFFTEKLHSVVNQLFNEMKQNTIIILENKEVGRVPLQIKSIYYIESSKHYVIYHSEHNEPIKSGTATIQFRLHEIHVNADTSGKSINDHLFRYGTFRYVHQVSCWRQERGISSQYRFLYEAYSDRILRGI